MAKKEQRFNELPVEEIPEVEAFSDVQMRLQAFRSANKAFFEYLDALSEEYNQKLEAADKAVRSRRASCGDFHLYQLQKKFDPELIFQSMGQIKFLEVGGVINTRTFYELDKTRFASALAGNLIPKELVAVAVTDEPKYHTPKKALLP
jgi:hypothetical protein